MSLCVHINDKPHSTEIDRLKSTGSSSSVSMGEEVTTSSNNSGSMADHQHPLVSCRNSSSNPEAIPSISAVLRENQDSEAVPKKFLDEDNEFYRYVDPKPAFPPSYKLVNPNKRARFPIYETFSKPTEVPPKYSPAVDEVTVVSIKSEWLSPYEPSSMRNWRNCLMEINSTQLNFYCIDESLTAGIRHYSNGDAKENSHHSSFLSFSTKSAYQFNKADQERICFNLKKNRGKYLTNDKIIKSYSLQYAKLGIPTDYTKRTFVLRMRCESEQFLLNFAHVDDMIMWTMYLQTGIGVALDLNLREYPNYRIVPRRRRRCRRRNRESLLFPSNLNNHKRSNSASMLQMHKFNSTSSPSSQNSSPRASPRPGNLKLGRSSSSGFFSNHGWSTNTGSNSSITEKPVLATAGREGPSAESKLAPTSFKSRLKGLFKSKGDGRVNSPRKAAVDKLQRQQRGLNCVMEDEEEENGSNVARTKSLPNNEGVLLDSKLQKSSPPTLCNAIPIKPPNSIKIPTPDESAFMAPQKNSTSLPATPRDELLLPDMAHPELRNVHVNHRELEEFREVVREHNEAEEGGNSLGDQMEDGSMIENLRHDDNDDDNDDEDDDEDEEDEDDEDDEDDQHNNVAGSSFDQSRSVYLDEGIFHDSDDDYVYESRMNYRNRASSTTSALSNTPYGSDEVKWSPPIKQITRRRYIRDSLRCIKPLSEGHRWIGKIVCRPSKAPEYETANIPIPIGSYSQELRRRKSSLSKHSWDNVDYKQTKNHYVKFFVVGPSGFSKAGTKLFDAWREGN